MSFIYRDFLSPSRWRWNSASSLYHRFDGVWGKETIDGIQVYSKKLIYWDGKLRSDKKFKRFINALGIEYEQLNNQKYEGVENVYFKLEPNKYTYTAPEKAAIVSDLNSVFNIGDEFELYIHYTGESKRVVPNQYTLKAGSPIGSTNINDYTIDKDAVRAELESDPMKYFANASLDSAGILNTTAVNSTLGSNTLSTTAIRRTPKTAPLTVVEYDEDTTHIYATLALLDNGSVFQKQGISSEMVTVKGSSDTMVWYEYSYKVKYKVVATATVGSYVVGQIDLLTNAIQDSLQAVKGNLALRTNHTLDTKLKEAAFEMNNVEAIGLTYNGQLRVDVAANMKRLEFVDMLGKILGTGYTKKKTKWYQKALAIVIVVAALVIGFLLSPVTGGMSIPAAMTVASLALGIAVAIISVSIMIYAAAFPYATDGIKMIAGAAQIIGFAAMVTGIMAAIQQSWQRYAAQEAAKQVGGQVAETSIGGYMKYLFNTAVDGLKSSVSSMTDKFTSFFNNMMEPSGWVNNLSQNVMNDVGGWMKNLNTGLDMYNKFFGEKPKDYTIAEDEQAVKEDGVEPIFTTLYMIDEIDALVKMDHMIKNSLGDQQTENFLVKIT